MTAPERIWAEPFYSINPDGRFWDDDEWHVSLEPDGTAIEWVRADLYATLAAKCEALESDAAQKALLSQLAVEEAERQVDRAEAAEARVRSLEEALREIARQKLTDEIEQHMLPYADFEAGYNRAVQVARVALSDTPREEGKT